ncbi:MULTISPECIES: NAD(P)H-hydrate dehydratase [Halomonadaceae]|uniref:NAD(P)H-hydrate dehydratase n=1 Tax=Halomonadaceae TaxID=28256 RepID=UPI0020106EB6|nr:MULTISPECIES: NAD(P)H-hydrate dehydratase [Halomonas]
MEKEETRSLYLAAQVRELDRRTIAAGVSGFALMQRAAMAAYQAMRSRWPDTSSISVLCGAGNNAGDGYVLAALAACDGLEVELIALRDADALTGDAALAVGMAKQADVTIRTWRSGQAFGGGLIVDALLGTGLAGIVRSPFSEAIETVNASGLPVFALDIPSGLSADSGAALGVAVRAEVTITFIADKLGLHTGAASAHVGEHCLATLGVEATQHDDLAPAAELLDQRLIASCLPPRPRDSHKGDQGHVLVIGGAPGFGGAALLAGEAAARLGAGKVSLATAREHVMACLVRCPEIMVHAVDADTDIEALLDAADIIVVGPGLGQGEWGHVMLKQSLRVAKPLVIDADGLNLLASRWPALKRDDWILTPHPGEAGRLLSMATDEIQIDRLGAVQVLQAQRGGAIVLKGAGTLVAGPTGVGVCPYGNPGMASGGMGDALSGMLAALLAQGVALETAARAGVILHARAADLAAEAGGERGLLASDLASYARRLANPRTDDASDTA